MFLSANLRCVQFRLFSGSLKNPIAYQLSKPAKMIWYTRFLHVVLSLCNLNSSLVLLQAQRTRAVAESEAALAKREAALKAEEEELQRRRLKEDRDMANQREEVCFHT
jgi:cell division protein FtsB